MASLANTRERRANAGARMAQMLDAEEEEFYKTTYGGFVEEADDNDYSSEASDDSDDEVDSDFSIDENDELISEDEDEEGKRKRKSVYQEPKKETKRPVKKAKIEKPKEKVKEERRKVEVRQEIPTFSAETSTKAALRESTRRVAAETEARVKIAREESEARKKSAKLNESSRKHRHLTQTELLREAKKTEQINLKSLERYRKMELEKSKKNKVVKEAIKGPIIRYHSVAMPLIEEINDEDNETEQESDKEGAKEQDTKEDNEEQNTKESTQELDTKEGIKKEDTKEEETKEDVKQETNEPESKQTEEKMEEKQNEEVKKQIEKVGKNKKDKKEIPSSSEEKVQKRCSRTFITFSDEETFKKYFPERKQPVAKRKLTCPISHLPARYFDPVTQLPFSSSYTFRAMREAYYKQLEQLGDMKQPEVAKWVNWRRRQYQPRIIQIIK